MSRTATESDRHFYRDADRAVLGGVFAGIAGHLGFNLCVTRALGIFAFLTAMPIAVIAYLAAVFLIPSRSTRVPGEVHEGRRSRRRRRRREKREAAAAMRSAPSAPMSELINRRCETLDERLIRLEKHVTSRRFQLEHEFSKL